MCGSLMRDCSTVARIASEESAMDLRSARTPRYRRVCLVEDGVILQEVPHQALLAKWARRSWSFGIDMPLANPSRLPRRRMRERYNVLFSDDLLCETGSCSRSSKSVSRGWHRSKRASPKRTRSGTGFQISTDNNRIVSHEISSTRSQNLVRESVNLRCALEVGSCSLDVPTLLLECVA